jgi:hypothetical protein
VAYFRIEFAVQWLDSRACLRGAGATIHEERTESPRCAPATKHAIAGREIHRRRGFARGVVRDGSVQWGRERELGGDAWWQCKEG